MNTTPVPTGAGMSVIFTPLPEWRPMPLQDMLFCMVRWNLIMTVPFFDYDFSNRHATFQFW
jgi:hypothetical protein